MQLDLFKETPVSNLSSELRLCKNCGEEKSLEVFHIAYYKRDGSSSRSHTCHSCKTYHNQIAIKLRKLNPKPKDSLCECCGEYTEKLVVDHNHKTEKFRGWLCTNCNQGIGLLKDDLETILKAVEYLRARE